MCFELFFSSGKMSLKTIISERGKHMLVLDKIRFLNISVFKNENKKWICFVTGCNEKFFTSNDENLVIDVISNVHNHEKNLENLYRPILSSGCKRKAVEDINEKPSKIISSDKDSHNNV